MRPLRPHRISTYPSKPRALPWASMREGGPLGPQAAARGTGIASTGWRWIPPELPPAGKVSLSYHVRTGPPREPSEYAERTLAAVMLVWSRPRIAGGSGENANSGPGAIRIRGVLVSPSRLI